MDRRKLGGYLQGEAITSFYPIICLEECKSNYVSILVQFVNLQHSKFLNHNGVKIVDLWNVNKFTDGRTKMEVDILRTKAIGSDLLVSLEEHFYQRLSRYTKQKI